jgi:hypothetical protein
MGHNSNLAPAYPFVGAPFVLLHAHLARRDYDRLTTSPAARFRIVSCGCAPKVGSFEYSAALPRAESAETAGAFRDQGLTGEGVGGKAYRRPR